MSRASFWERDPDKIASIFVHEIEVGIEDSDVRAGVIKVANDEEGVTPHAGLVLRGAARALKRTGCPISTHTWAPGEVGTWQVEIFRQEGAPLDRICIGHSADSTDLDYLESLLQSGVYLSMDRYPGREGRARLAAAKRHGEGVDRARLGQSPHARSRLCAHARAFRLSASTGARNRRPIFSSPPWRSRPSATRAWTTIRST